MMISDHERLREKNTRLESERKGQETLKQQISRVIEEDKREHDQDITEIVRKEVKKQVLSSLSKEELLIELEKRK